MQTIDLQKIIQDQQLDPQTVARELFPDNKYPDLALRRVLKGEALLNTQQISRLSLFTGIPISDLFSQDQWKAKTSEGKHIFTNGDFRAVLDPATWTTSIFHKDVIFHEKVIHSNHIPLGEYIDMLNNLIQNYNEFGND